MAKELTILDGGLGHWLKLQGVSDLVQGLPFEKQFLAVAVANVECPKLVKEAHTAFIQAGAQVITTNTFSVTPWSLTRIGRQQDTLTITHAAGQLAREAADSAGSGAVLVAGCLPPLQECYRASTLTDSELLEGYRGLVSALASHVDLFLCETHSTAREAAAAAQVAAATGKPVWVSWTLVDDTSATLRGGESLQEAVAALSGMSGLQACLLNCSAPETITAALPLLKKATEAISNDLRVGAYGNGFKQTTSQWLATESEQGSTEVVQQLVQSVVDDFDAVTGCIMPEAYATWASKWQQEGGATIVGGCCGISPNVIQEVAQRLRAAH